MPSKFIHVVVCIRISFLFKAEEYSIVCMYHIFIHFLSVHPLMDIWVTSTFLAIANNAAMNVGVHMIMTMALTKL